MPPQSYLQFAFGQEKGKMTVMSTALLPQYDQPSKVFTTVKQRKEQLGAAKLNNGWKLARCADVVLDSTIGREQSEIGQQSKYEFFLFSSTISITEPKGDHLMYN